MKNGPAEQALDKKLNEKDIIDDNAADGSSMCFCTNSAE